MSTTARTHSWGVQAQLACLAFASLSISFGTVYFGLTLTEFAYSLSPFPTVTTGTGIAMGALGVWLGYQFSSAPPNAIVPALCVQAIISFTALPLLYLTSPEPIWTLTALSFHALLIGGLATWSIRGLQRAAPQISPPALLAGVGFGLLLPSLPLPLAPLLEPHFHQALSVWFLGLAVIALTPQLHKDRGLWLALGTAVLLAAAFQMLFAPRLIQSLEHVYARLLMP